LTQEEAPIPISTLLTIAWMQRWLVLMVTVICVVIGVIVTLLTPELYESSALLEVAPDAGQELEVKKLVYEQPTHNMYMNQQFYRTQIQKITSLTSREEVITRYAAQGFDDLQEGSDGANKLQNMLSVASLPNSRLVKITITHSDPQRAAILANTVAYVYLESNIHKRQDAASRAEIWLEDQIGSYNSEIEGMSQDLLAFQSESGLTDIEASMSTLSATIQNLNAAFATLNTERLLLETEVRDYSSLFESGKYQEMAKLTDSRVVIKLVDEYAQARAAHTAQGARFGERHPTHRTSLTHLLRLEEELRTQVENDLSAERVRLGVLTSKEKRLRNELERTKRLLLEKQALVIQYDAKASRLEHSRSFYSKLKQRQDELDLTAQTQINNATIIDDARPAAAPIRPRPILNIAVSVAVGLVGGFALGVGRELLDDTFHNGAEVERVLGVPYLGHVPEVSKDHDGTLFTFENPKSTPAEAVRGIRTVLQGTYPMANVMLVTSAAVSEGKSSTVTRLGVAYAKLGRRVVLIDADLRRPRLHRIFGIENDAGLTEALHEGMDPLKLVRSTSVPDLCVLTSGARTDRPNELLASAQVREVIDRVREDFDVVLLDTPPTLMVSDALVLSRVVDGVIVVVRAHTHTRALTRLSIDRLKSLDARIFGIVLNAVDPRSSYSHYRYYASPNYYYADPPPDDDAPLRVIGSA